MALFFCSYFLFLRALFILSFSKLTAPRSTGSSSSNLFFFYLLTALQQMKSPLSHCFMIFLLLMCWYLPSIAVSCKVIKRCSSKKTDENMFMKTYWRKIR